MMSRSAIAALAFCAGVLSGTAVLAQATSPPSTPWAMRRRPFDNVAVTPSPSLSGRGGGPHSFHASIQNPGGQFRAEGLTLHDLARFAFQLDDTRIVAGPDWINSLRFDIVANVDSELHAGLFPSMIRAVLVEHFKLSSHLETRQFPVYALVRATGPGPGLLPSHVNCAHPQRGKSPETPLCGIVPDRWGHLSARGVTLKAIAANMRHWSPHVDREIVDRTGLTGRFDFDLSFFPLEVLQMDVPHFAAWLDRFGVHSVFSAVEQQLGLALVDAYGPGDVLVIDHAEPPSRN